MLITAIIVCMSAFVAVIFLVSSKYIQFWLISPAVMMFAYFLLVSFPGLFLASSEEVLLGALIAHLVWFLGVALALVCFALMQPRRHSAYLVPRRIHANRTAIWFFVLLSVPAVVLTYAMLGRIPLFIGMGSLCFGGGDISMHAARQMNTLLHKSGDTFYFGQGYLRQIYTVVSPVFLVALLVFDRLRPHGSKSQFIFAAMVFLVLAAALNGQIWVAADVILLFIMGKYFVALSSRGKINGFSLIGRGILVYIFLVGFVFAYRYLQFIQGRAFNDFFLDTIGRLYSAGGVELFGIFPSSEGFRYGATWLNDLSGMLPGSIESFSYEVHYLIHGGAWGFTLSPGIVASSYVNFGFIGVFGVAFCFTWLFTLIFSRLINSRSAVKIAIAIYISHRFTMAMPGDITSYVVCLVSAAMMYLFYIFLASFISQVLGKNYSNYRPVAFRFRQ
jgi:hypothetical protein